MTYKHEFYFHPAVKDFSHFLKPYQEKIEEKIRELISNLGAKNTLRDACEYALLNGGKRFRPALVYMVAKALGNTVDVSDAALAVELFHTASLVADDLPCMDNDDERRNKPTTHKVFGESTALLVSYALISAGYESLTRNAHVLERSPAAHAKECDRLAVLAVQNVSYNTGLLGATGGQYLDIQPPDLSLETLRKIIHKKTNTLFEISFVLGWLFGGGAIEKIDSIKKAAAHFGMAFQIADDIDDIEQDKQNKRFVNIAAVFGVEKALEIIQEELDAYQMIIQGLHLPHAVELIALAKSISSFAQECAKLAKK